MLMLVAPGPLILGFDFLIVLSLLSELGLETDATEDDFGVWEVKTMVAVILHLLEGPSGKVPLTTCHLFPWVWVNACLVNPQSPLPHLLPSLKDHKMEAPLSPPHPLQLSFFLFFKYFIYLLSDRGDGRERERKRNITAWLPHAHPQSGLQIRHVP